MYETGLQRGHADVPEGSLKAAKQGHEGAKIELRKQRPAAPASQSPTSSTCANCGVAGAAGGGALKQRSQCKAMVPCGKESQMRHCKAGDHKAVCK